MRVFKKFAPDAIKLKMLDALYGGAATALRSKKVSISKIEELVDKGTDLIKLNNALDKAATIPKIGNVEVDDIIHILINEKINIDETLGFIKRSNGGVSWLEVGKLSDASKRALDNGEFLYDVGGSGLEHILHNHVRNPDGNQLLQYGEKYIDEIKVKNLIMISVEKGEKIIKDGDIWHVYEVPNSGGRILSTLVGSNGYIVSIIPQNIIQ